MCMYKKHKIHLVGIGGIGMSGIAEVLLNLKYPISGSDLKSSPIIRRLRKKGAKIYYGHRGANLADAEVVVTSSAINSDNPEVVEAKKKGLPVIQRAEMLAELMRFSPFGVAISGTHGKTTTTSLVASVLNEGGLDPTLIIGGRVNSLRSNARLGKGDFMVAEADESDGSFLKLSPVIAVITNIDREHMDYYQDFERVKEAYRTFAQKVPFYGLVVCCVEHPVVSELVGRIEKRVVTYGFSEKAVYMAKNIRFCGNRVGYDLSVHGKERGEVVLNMPGRHNVLNSLAAIAVGDELGIPFSKARTALKKFTGIERRCDLLLETENYLVIDDYGHHPEEIKATLTAIREVYPGKRIVCFFQPHRFTRTRDLFLDLAASFDSADLVLLTDIYPAGEPPIDGVSSIKLVEAMKPQRGESVEYVPRHSKIVDDVVKRIQPGDVLVSLGAGDITKMGKECAMRLKKI